MNQGFVLVLEFIEGFRRSIERHSGLGKSLGECFCAFLAMSEIRPLDDGWFLATVFMILFTTTTTACIWDDNWRDASEVPSRDAEGVSIKRC